MRYLKLMLCGSRIFVFFLVLVTCGLVACELSYANNASVTNGALGTQDTVNDTMVIQFDLSWENSWRKIAADAPYNYDAVWVFVKYSVDSGTTWSHAYLSTTTGDHIIPANYECKVGTSVVSSVTQGMGVFLQRADPVTTSFAGTSSLTGVKLLWKYGLNGVTDAQAGNPATISIRIMALEMVYIPAGTFTAGTTTAENSSLFKTVINTGNASVVPSGSPLTGGYSTGRNGWDCPIASFTTPNAAYPNGYNAFYIMKYEISQQQFVDFFNTLTATQKTGRDITATGFKGSQSTVARNSISWAGGTADASAGANSNDTCNYLNPASIMAFADWAGLRPFTELEYEKAGRGTAAPVDHEYAWGGTTIAGSAYTLANDGTASEGIATNYSTTAGNAAYTTTTSALGGPLRGGIFAAHANNTGRVSSGASYYGVFDLTGNVWETVIDMYYASTTFTGLSGLGSLNSDGTAHLSTLAWPGSGSGTGNCGFGSFLGGSWVDTGFVLSADGCGSSNPCAFSSGNGWGWNKGGRVARTAPA